MSLLVLALLVGLWSAILLPGAVRAHRASSSLSTVDAFRQAMERLAARADGNQSPAEPGEVPPGAAAAELTAAEWSDGDGPEWRSDVGRHHARRRRQIVLGVLCGGLLVGVAGALSQITVLAWLLVADAVALAGYLGLWAGLHSRAEEARRKVRPLPARPPSDSPPPATTDAVALPRAAGEQG